MNGMLLVAAACILLRGSRAYVKKIPSAARSLSTSKVAQGLDKSIEREVRQSYLIGVDEVGRGALAGPVVAAAVLCLDKEEDMRMDVKDSKKLSVAQREEIFEIISNDDSRYIISWAMVDHNGIDEMNILQATMRAMSMSVSQCVDMLLTKNPEITQDTDIFGIIDGNKIPSKLPIHARPMVKADTRCYSVALGSIVAKVTRDQMMKDFDENYPEYGFRKHKGYPTREHILAIDRHGACPIHRMSFKPLKGKKRDL